MKEVTKMTTKRTTNNSTKRLMEKMTKRTADRMTKRMNYDADDVSLAMEVLVNGPSIQM
jgi:hypothetical protein